MQLQWLYLPDKLGPTPRRGLVALLQLGKCDLLNQFPNDKVILVNTTFNTWFKPPNTVPILWQNTQIQIFHENFFHYAFNFINAILKSDFCIPAITHSEMQYVTWSHFLSLPNLPTFQIKTSKIIITMHIYAAAKYLILSCVRNMWFIQFSSVH